MIRRQDGTIDLVATYEFMFKAKPGDAAIAYLHQIEEIALDQGKLLLLL